MSILRFKSAPKENPQSPTTIGISNCGFEVTVIKQKKSKSDGKEAAKKSEQQLVLTNMSFSTGVHVWEIICPISCQDIYVGAYNPMSQVCAMETFYNTTPRSIFVCLDLNKYEIKFWLNEHKVSRKILKLDHSAGPGQQWIPAIKISRERNHAILNPFPYIPLDFTEDASDRNFEYSKLLIPHLFNTICVTGLPRMSAESSVAVDQLKKFLHLSNNQLSKITLYKTLAGQDSVEGASGSNETLCFLKFHNYEMMHDFIELDRQKGKNEKNEKEKKEKTTETQAKKSKESQKEETSPFKDPAADTKAADASKP